MSLGFFGILAAIGLITKGFLTLISSVLTSSARAGVEVLVGEAYISKVYITLFS